MTTARRWMKALVRVVLLCYILVTTYIGKHNFINVDGNVHERVKNSTRTAPLGTAPGISAFPKTPATISDYNGELLEDIVVMGDYGSNDSQSSISSGIKNSGEGEPLVIKAVPVSSEAVEDTKQVVTETQYEMATNAIDKAPSACCFRTLVDLESKLTPEYFEHQRSNFTHHKMPWTGTEYEEWVAIAKRLNPNDVNHTNLDCTTQYSLLVMNEVYGYYLRLALNELGNGHLDTLPYYEEKPGVPRILLLGDSISLGIRAQTQHLYHEQANILGAPMNCLGFARHETHLNDWLGSCPWDLVQFNVGMHYHPKVRGKNTTWHKEYRRGITDIVNTIRAHSPSARIVFALTTPSPFDSKATTPKKSTCPHYKLFHKKGLVAAMNKVAISVAKELGITINDRYSSILPALKKYQLECDIHFVEEGYRFMAKKDWKVLSAALAMASPVETTNSTSNDLASSYR